MQSARDHRTKATDETQPDRASRSRSLSEPVAGSLAGPDHTRLAGIATAINTAPSAQRRASLPPPNRTGLPDRLKSGIETLSGISLDTVRVHRNSPEPARLSAHAFARGTDIHLAPGQERHLPHEAWHVVQQAQGRVKPTMHVTGGVLVNDDVSLENEAGIMGDRATQRLVPPLVSEDRASMSEKDSLLQTEFSAHGIVQRVFVFQVEPDDYTIYNSAYLRTQGKRFMTGNQDRKHVTANTLKRRTFHVDEKTTLSDLATQIVSIGVLYFKLPGMDLLPAHYSSKDLPSSDIDLQEHAPNGIIGQNFDEFMSVKADLRDKLESIVTKQGEFDHAVGKHQKDAAAFHLQNDIMTASGLLEMFRDMMPLVNILSGLQSRGKEPEANQFLDTRKPTGKIDSNMKALWAYFDFAAIKQISIPEDMDHELGLSNAIASAIPWLSPEKARELTALATGSTPEETSMNEVVDYIAALMLANHVQLTTVSYPREAAECEFGSKSSIEDALKAEDWDDESAARIAQLAFLHIE